MPLLQDRQLDFEDFSSDTEKLSAILKRCEVSGQKHKLCYEYYRARKFALLHPSVMSCVAIGVLGFTVTTSAIKRHMKIGDVQVEDMMTLVVGMLGFLVGMNVLLMNQWDFGSRESMHLSALIELDQLGDRIRFWKMDRKVGTGKGGPEDDGEEDYKEKSNKNLSGEDFSKSERKALGLVEAPESHKVALVVASGKQLKKVEKEIQQKTVRARKTEDKRSDVSRFSGYNGAYHQINRSCKSDIPSKLSRPFDLFETRLECMSLGHLGVVWDTRMRRNQIMRLAAVEIYNEITGYWAWPFGTPDIENVIDRSMKRVARLISKDYRAPIKVECCGFTIFRCCCKQRQSESNVLSAIVEGLEGQEQGMMLDRGATDYLETGKMNRNPMEDDAFDAEQRLQSMEYDSRAGGRSNYSRGSYSRGGYSRGGYSRGDEQSAYTEDDDSYTRGRGRAAPRQNGQGYSRGSGYSREESLTRSGNDWDEASESQYGY
jgi:hypothetical protein